MTKIDKTNILLIMSDDHGYWAMGCAGNSEVRTPNLDRLAANGVRFDNFFCASPVCSPARASVYTGKIPSQHGIHDWLAKGHLDEDVLSDELKQAFNSNDGAWEFQWPKNQLKDDRAIHYLDNHTVFTEILKDNGYNCGFCGKWHMGDSFTPQAGFDFWRTTAMGGENYYYPVVLENGHMELKRNVYVTNWITDNALEFLDQPHNQPYYLAVHYTAPHAPWTKEHHPAEFYNMYNDCKFNSVPDEPPHPWGGNTNMSYEAWQNYRANCLHGYYAAISAMDADIGKLLDKIDDNTLVIFTGDNGMAMGHHGIFGKGNGTFPMNMFEESIKVPVIFSKPSDILSGKVCHEMVSHYDLYETILDLADINFAKPDNLPGESFMTLLYDTETKFRDEIVVYDEYGPVRMIRTTDWKYIHRYPYGSHELYDLINDPNEKNNLINETKYQPKVLELRERLRIWYLKYADPEFDGSKEAVAGSGQLTPHSHRQH